MSAHFFTQSKESYTGLSEGAVSIEMLVSDVSSVMCFLLRPRERRRDAHRGTGAQLPPRQNNHTDDNVQGGGDTRILEYYASYLILELKSNSSKIRKFRKFKKNFLNFLNLINLFGEGEVGSGLILKKKLKH